MPAWLAKQLALKLLSSLVQGVNGGDGLKRLLQAIVFLLLFILAIILTLPALMLQVPFIGAEKLNDFFDTAGAASLTTQTDYDPAGVEIPWDEVVAAWAVLYEQDFNEANEGAIQELAREWAERHEEEIEHSETYYDSTTGEMVEETWTETIVWYTLRGLDEVMPRLGMSVQQQQQTRTYLASLREGGLRPPTGWQARPGIGWFWPVSGHDSAAAISSPYGFRIHPITNQPQVHAGVDIVAPEGTPVVAAREGTAATGYDQELGNYVVVRGQGFETFFGHLNSIKVHTGEEVSIGEKIGTVGNSGKSTGAHLHFSVKFAGRPQNPLQYY